MALQTPGLPAFVKNFSLEGKVAFVTGGTGGIGIGLCRVFAESGADIISLQLPLDPIDVKQVVEQAGKACHIYHCDLLDLKSLAPVGATTEFPISAIERVIRLNTTASIIVTRELVKYWLKQEGPDFTRKIVNFASISSFQGNVENLAYVASKGAVLNMTRGMSNEWAPHGINDNCVTPGYTKSRMTERIYNDEAYNEKLYKKLPAQRWGEPEDIAAACVYLSSPASDYVTGTCVVVDGG